MQVHRDENRKHREREDRRPLQQEAEHHQDETDILGMTDVTIGARRRQPAVLLRVVEHAPSRGDQDESAAYEDKAQDME
jgi:hypothetical protein